MLFLRRSRTITALLGIAAAVLLAAVSHLLIGQRRLTLNDTHLLWLVDGTDYFVRPPFARGDAGLVATHPELRRLDNGTECFHPDKKPGTFRIVCIGGSTTRGWPFHRYISYPAALSMMLRDQLPGRRIEVINAGILGSDSWSDRALVAETLSRYHPDLLLLYEGRNEEWNYPVHAAMEGSWHLRTHAWLLKHVRLYGLIRKLASRGAFDHAEVVRRLAGQTYGREYHAIEKAFIRNMDDIASRCAAAGCRLMVMTQVTTGDERARGTVVVRLNDALRAFAPARGIPVIDLEQAFADSGIPDARLFIPVNIHPDLHGYFLMARTVAAALRREGIAAPPSAWDPSRLRPDGEYLSRRAVTSWLLRSVYEERFSRLHVICDDPAALRWYREKIAECGGDNGTGEATVPDDR